MTRSPITGLVGCVICGFSVGIMWPGTLSISSKQLPLGGTAMFALLAMAGDLGGALGPSAVGWFTQMSGDNLRMGMRFGCVFPVIIIIGLWILNRNAERQ